MGNLFLTARRECEQTKNERAKEHEGEGRESDGRSRRRNKERNCREKSCGLGLSRARTCVWKATEPSCEGAEKWGKKGRWRCEAFGRGPLRDAAVTTGLLRAPEPGGRGGETRQRKGQDESFH